MKHIQTLEFLYKKYNDKTLLDSDMANYYKMYNITLNPNGKINRLSNASFVSDLTELGQTKELLNSHYWTMSNRLRHTLLSYNLLFYTRIYLLIPVLFISFDGQFKSRLKILLDKAFFDPNYLDVSENSYIVLMERSDIMLRIEVLHTRSIPSEVITIIRNDIKKGCFLSGNHQDEIHKRIVFWNSLNFFELDINVLDINQIGIIVFTLDEWRYYFNYLKEKKRILSR